MKNGVTQLSKILSRLWIKRQRDLFVENENNIDKTMASHWSKQLLTSKGVSQNEGSAKLADLVSSCSGHAQRFQIQEKPMSHEMVDGKW